MCILYIRQQLSISADLFGNNRTIIIVYYFNFLFNSLSLSISVLLSLTINFSSNFVNIRLQIQTHTHNHTSTRYSHEHEHANTHTHMCACQSILKFRCLYRCHMCTHILRMFSHRKLLKLNCHPLICDHKNNTFVFNRTRDYTKLLSLVSVYF